MMQLPEPLFLDGPRGRVFALYFPPHGQPKRALLHLPAFAEEMNRCRYTVASQARKANALGYACLLLDPFGTGDSDGELSDATWDDWLGDALVAADWLAAKTGTDVTLWGLRLGALVAANLADRHPDRFHRVMLWQPVIDGKLFLTQYLRLRVAYLMDKGLPAETTDSIREAMAAGTVLEVAGYPLSGGLSGQIDQVRLTEFSHLQSATIDWFELVAQAEKPVSIGSRKVIEQLTESGCSVHTSTFTGPPLWNLHKRDELPNLIEVTTTALEAEA